MPRHGTSGGVLSTPRSTGERILGITADGIRRGIMIHGITAIPGAGAIRGVTEGGTTHGIGTLGTIADGTEAGMEAGMNRGITEDGDTSLITTTSMTSSARAAGVSTLRAWPQPAHPTGETESVPRPGAPESGVHP